jgi:hypothetical protein
MRELGDGLSSVDVELAIEFEILFRLEKDEFIPTCISKWLSS